MSSVHIKDYQVPQYLIPEVHLEFDLHPTKTIVHNTMKTVKNPQSSQTSETLFLNGENLKLVEVKRNGVVLSADDYNLTDSGLVLKNMPAECSVSVITEISPETNTSFSGLYKTKNMYCTQMEAEGFRTVTYFQDRPDVLSQYKTTIRGPKATCPTLLSNGYIVEECSLDDGFHQVIWEDPFPKPCYLFALVAGDFDQVSDSYETQSKKQVELNIYVDKGKAHRAHHAMSCLKQSMLWDEQTYGLEYDLPIYNIVAVDDFNMGAMENKGLNIFNSKYVLADQETATDEEYVGILRVIGHEYFHNWSGNRVTCRDWFQLSLKEGLTVYRDQEFTCDLTDREVKRIEDVALLRNRQFSEDAGPMAHPVRPQSYQSIDNFYTMTVYHKGAEVIRMLAQLLDEHLYKKGISLYFTKHDGQAVTIDDFVTCMEEVSGRDLSQFKLWYDQAGTPKVDVRPHYNSKTAELTLEVKQSLVDPISGAPLLPMVIPIKMGLIGPEGEALQFSEPENNEQLVDQVQLELTAAQQTFKIKNVAKKPVLSLLRDFSAPVLLEYGASDEDLYHQLKFDTNGFCRWEAGQTLFMNYIVSIYNDLKAGTPRSLPNSFADSIRQIMSKGLNQPALTGQLLQIPSRHYLGQNLGPFNPLRLDQALFQAKISIVQALRDLFLENYQALSKAQEKVTSQDEIFVRRLKNITLNYLLCYPDEQSLQWTKKQFENSNNMTDQLACLTALSQTENSLSEELSSQFYAKWKDDSLVLNKWFFCKAIHRSKSAFEGVRSVLALPSFQKSNPNNLYALVNTFVTQNWVGFYENKEKATPWFGEFIEEIDKQNPQVSARLGTALNIWKDLEPDFSEPLRKELRRLSDASLSKNLGEIVQKALQ